MSEDPSNEEITDWQATQVSEEAFWRDFEEEQYWSEQAEEEE